MTGGRLAGETQAQAWLKEVMADDSLDATLIRWAVAPVGRGPGQLPQRSRVVCKCADVSQAEITADLAAGATLALLQEKRGCGTFCGAYQPELREMIGSHATGISSVAAA